MIILLYSSDLRYFAPFMTMQEKQILARDIEIQKPKVGLTVHFSEIL